MEKKEKLQKISHIIAGLMILFHAYEKYESGHGPYAWFAVAGIVFLCIALFHHPLKSRFPWIDGCFFSIEAVLSLIVAYDYFHMGKTGLPFMYLLAALLQFTGIYLFYRRSKKISAGPGFPQKK